MPMKASRSLNQEVDRRKFANHPVEIEIEALFDYLSGDQDGGPIAFPLLSKSVKDHFLDALPVSGRKPRVKELHLDIEPLAEFPEARECCLRCGHSVDDKRSEPPVMRDRVYDLLHPWRPVGLSRRLNKCQF